MALDSVWRLIPKFSKFLVFSAQRLIAEVPRDRAHADLNAKAISLLPQFYDSARALSDSPWGDFVASDDVVRANALLAAVKGFEPSAWRYRQRSVLQFSPRPLIAHTCDESLAVAIATLPQLVGSLRFLTTSADADAIQRVTPCALRAVREVCWDVRLDLLWRDAPRRFPPRGAVADHRGIAHSPQSIAQREAHYFIARIGKGAA